MRNNKLLTVWLLVGVALSGCELPKEPDFTTSHTIEGPLLVNKTFQFLGGGGSTDVLIDTTSSEFDSLFTLDGDGFISLSREEEFDFGDLDGAIPEISTDPTSFNSQVGELELGSFSSGGGSLGSASFQNLTGLDPAFVPAGTAIPAGASPGTVNIDVGSNTDFFVSATIKSGAIQISITNNLGFNLTTVQVNLNSGSTFVSGVTINNVDHGQTTSDQIAFTEGDVLSNINVDVNVSWVAQTTQAEPGDLIVENIDGVNLIASSVEAAVEPQDFSTSNTTTFDAADFQFTSAAHYVELESGVINIAPIINDLPLSVESLVISFPSIIAPPSSGTTYNPADSLVIDYTGGIPASSGGVSGQSEAQNVDLTGYRLYALNNEITYNIVALTENTQNAAPGNQTRVISETDQISSSVEINNLAIATAFGEIVPQIVVLGDDDLTNGEEVLDLYNDLETELTEIDGLEDLSKEIEGIEFTQATVSINYESNIGIPTAIYGAFLGINGEGEEIYLRGLPGTNAAVLSSDPIDGLLSNGTQIPADSLIKFELEPSVSGGLESFSLTFDETNSTVGAFLNNLPSQIRFIGKAIVNEDGTEATISTPLQFDPMISVNLPLAFRTSDATIFSDTTETDALQDLPAPGDDANLTEGLLNIRYQNGLPLGFNLKLEFLDAGGNVFMTLPSPAETYDLLGAQINEVTRFAETPTSDVLQIALTDQQLSDLYQTASIRIESGLRTSQNSEVKFRATDAISLSVSAKISIENKVQN